MQLNNLTVFNESSPVNIAVFGEKILTVGPGTMDDNDTDPFQIQFTDAMAIPGLINSHDHLDFNCFTILGQRKYNNYTEWGSHIHETFKENINATLKIPAHFRIAWGMYKNLLSGITTVVNHGPFLSIENPLINIHQETQNLHSVHFEKNWKWKLNNLLHINKDCVIHAGEGVDEEAVSEIDELIRFNLLKRSLVCVHGVALKPAQARHFKALVWCPESNRVLLNGQPDIERLKDQIQVVLGTDSTLTGSWNIWHHLRLARSLQKVTDIELFSMVTASPARLWNMNNGSLQVKKDADIVILKKKNNSPVWDDFYKTNPEDILMVMHKGNIRMFDKIILSQLSVLPVNLDGFSQIRIKDSIKFVEGDLPGLMTAIKDYYPQLEFPVESFETVFNYTYD